MENQIYVLPEEQIKYPPFQAQKLVIEGTHKVHILKMVKGIIFKEITGFIPQPFIWITIYEVMDEDVMEDQIYCLKNGSQYHLFQHQEHVIKEFLP